MTQVLADLTKTDWPLLAHQKRYLVKRRRQLQKEVDAAKRGMAPPQMLADIERLSGLIHFLDHVQDEAAKTLGDKAVFGSILRVNHA